MKKSIKTPGEEVCSEACDSKESSIEESSANELVEMRQQVAALRIIINDLLEIATLHSTSISKHDRLIQALTHLLTTEIKQASTSTTIDLPVSSKTKAGSDKSN